MLKGLNKEYVKKLLIIYEHFGEINQKAKLLEEIEEVEEALLNASENHCYWENLLLDEDAVACLLEEIADCYVVATQVGKVGFLENLLESMVYFHYDGECDIIAKLKIKRKNEILEIAKFKIDRTIKRYDINY